MKGQSPVGKVGTVCPRMGVRMITRLLKAEIDKNNAKDVSQETDISALETAVGEVPSGEGNDLQSQITALDTRVTALENEETTGEA